MLPQSLCGNLLPRGVCDIFRLTGDATLRDKIMELKFLICSSFLMFLVGCDGEKQQADSLPPQEGVRASQNGDIEALIKKYAESDGIDAVRVSALSPSLVSDFSVAGVVVSQEGDGYVMKCTVSYKANGHGFSDKMTIYYGAQGQRTGEYKRE